MLLSIRKCPSSLKPIFLWTVFWLIHHTKLYASSCLSPNCVLFLYFKTYYCFILIRFFFFFFFFFFAVFFSLRPLLRPGILLYFIYISSKSYSDWHLVDVQYIFIKRKCNDCSQQLQGYASLPSGSWNCTQDNKGVY